MKQEFIYDYLIPTTILERKKDYFRHQKKLDEIKVGKARKNISFFQSEDVKQNQKIKKNSFYYRQQEQQLNLYKENTKMFFKLLNISTNSNFSTIPPVVGNGGQLSAQNKSQQKINTKDFSLNSEILVDLQNFEKNSQLQQVVEVQTNSRANSTEHASVTVPGPQRQSLTTQHKKRNSASPTNATHTSSSVIQSNQGQIQISTKQTDFLDKIYKENLQLHQRLLEMDSVLNKKNFDKFHNKQQEYKSRLSKFQVDQSTNRVKMKCSTYIDRFATNSSLNKSREDLSKKKDGRQSSSSKYEQDSQPKLEKEKDEIIEQKQNNNSSQNKLTTYPKSFFTEIDYNESSSKLNSLKVKGQIRSKTRDQSLSKTANRQLFDSQVKIENKKKHPSQIEIGVQSYLRNARPKTNYTVSGNERNMPYSNQYQRAHTSSNSDQHDTLGYSNNNRFRDKSMQDLKNQYGDNSILFASNKPTVQQTQRMENQFKNFFSTSARSVSLKKNQFPMTQNIGLNNNQQKSKKNIQINQPQVNIQAYQQIKSNNPTSTRNANNNQQYYYNGFRKNQYSQNHRNNNFVNQNNSLNNSHLNHSSTNNNSFNTDYKQNQYQKNNFIVQNKSNLSKSTIQEKDKSPQKLYPYTPVQGIEESRIMDEYKKQSKEIYKQYKVSFEQISPYSIQNQQLRRRIQTVHHADRKNDQATQKIYPKIQREKLVPLTQVKEEDHLQQTLEAVKLKQDSTLTIPEKISL
ncbi:hypothetical protein TTHERM_00467270 (macronuclear) [Tetrahymena thermophila SB210]|uniref:Uncharacterized protein n=1 Tax=Tetrahymena thermophila (strain SB210) TaxID=312017 RepID=I7LXJ7_TETTS|nr:hypothetical protein TTHERM_00467270 [Tetrahymena thermophila SB210]EAS04778.3 hypothetical protein TTHERM_00467270 [Tetrahymena thermophila SB210]|eukprot:XP_001025023.3 hypothetical protein TTHERM_00467270 [Tetrahymena thermophila SB210]